MKFLPIILSVSILVLLGCSKNKDNQDPPFNKKQILELQDGITKGIKLSDVTKIMGRHEGEVWSYSSNSGTVPITVHTWHDKWGRSVVGHFNNDGIMVFGEHNVRSFQPE